MFTGLIRAVGVVDSAFKSNEGLELWVGIGELAASSGVGDSIALSGVCCTATAIRDSSARFVLSDETLDRTWLGGCGTGTRLNLEPALRAGEPLGGHLVQGHVDGVGTVVRGVDAQLGGELVVDVTDGLSRYCVEKGSISIDGVSLTIARIEGAEITVAVIPHTVQVTTMGSWAPGQPLNLEVDVLAKYVERLLGDRIQPIAKRTP